MTLPKIVDNDRDEITAVFAGKEIRGWSYEDRDKHLAKMKMAHEFVEGYDQGQRTLLNALLAFNPELESRLAKVSGREPCSEGKLPFDAVFWVTGVAEQLDIQPREYLKPTNKAAGRAPQ